MLSPIYIYSSIIFTQENVNMFSPDIAVVLGSGTTGVSEIGVNGTSALVNVSAAMTYDFVDNNISDIDSSPDKGTHSNFTAQQYGPDSINDTLTEENTGGSTNTTLISAESFEGTWPPTGWSGTDRWNKENDQAYDGTYSADYDGRGSGSSGELDSPILNCSDANAIYVDFWYRVDMHSTTESDDFLLQYYNGSNWNTIYDLGFTTQQNQWIHYQEKVSDSQYLISNFQVRWAAVTINNGEHVYVDYVTIEKEVGTDNYEIDLEIQWTNAIYYETNEELCIHGGIMGSENITVDVWNGSAWQNVFTNLASGWNNASVASYLDSSNFTIRFKGDTETGDITQDTWNIDAALLHVWTDTYDYILSVTSQKTYDQNIRLSLYNSNDVNRLSNCTIWFRDGTTSIQTNVTNGVVVQDLGPWYLLPASGTRYIVVYAEESAAGTSVLYIELEAVEASSIVYTCLIELTVN